MRKRIPCLRLWLGLVRGWLFAAALRSARRLSLRGWAPALGGAARHPRRWTGGGLALSFRYQPS
jgi:hypothetical protein